MAGGVLMAQFLHLDGGCPLGVAAKKYWDHQSFTGKPPLYMRISGDGYICFGIREDLPHHTQQPHFTDDDGSKYDQYETKIPISVLVKEFM
jgi:hypothetical protein